MFGLQHLRFVVYLFRCISAGGAVVFVIVHVPLSPLRFSCCSMSLVPSSLSLLSLAPIAHIDHIGPTMKQIANVSGVLC